MIRVESRDRFSEAHDPNQQLFTTKFFPLSLTLMHKYDLKCLHSLIGRTEEVARIVPEAKEFQEHFKISAIFDQDLFTPIKTTKKCLL